MEPRDVYVALSSDPGQLALVNWFIQGDGLTSGRCVDLQGALKFAEDNADDFMAHIRQIVS